MPRLRGPKAVLPIETSPFLLNHYLFGSHERGGQTPEVRRECLPVNWDEIYGRSARLEVEIGFNRGVFLSELAEIEPDINVLGIEIQRRYCWRLANIFAWFSYNRRISTMPSSVNLHTSLAYGRSTERRFS